MKDKIIIFTDGSSKGNPGPGGWGSIIVHDGEVVELGGGDPHTTNNKMELTAAIEALKYLSGSTSLTTNLRLEIHTDSEYVGKGMKEWIFSWQRNGWRTATKKPVLNKELWQELSELSSGKEITWTYVAGHIGIPANERCDEIANAFAGGEPSTLFKGRLSNYKVDIKNLSGFL